MIILLVFRAQAENAVTTSHAAEGQVGLIPVAPGSHESPSFMHDPVAQWVNTAVLALLVVLCEQFQPKGVGPVHVRLASSPGHSQILTHSCEEKLGKGLGSLLRHWLERWARLVRNVDLIGLH